MIADRLRPAIDRTLGIARPAVRIAVGTSEYDAIRDSLAVEAIGHTMTPLSDPEFNRSQSEAVRNLLEAPDEVDAARATSPRCCGPRWSRTSGC